MRLKVTIKPETAFASALLGETMFGQLYWAIRLSESEQFLTRCLEGYLNGRPFLVVSDAFPSGYLPLPVLPSSYWEKNESASLKDLKRRQWISINDIDRPVSQWQKNAISMNQIEKGKHSEGLMAHNSINRNTSTTGTDGFAPYLVSQTWYSESSFDLYVVIDERLAISKVEQLFNFVGQIGFGRDASTGLGKFRVEAIKELPDNPSSTCFMTLASCSPQSDKLVHEKCFYRTKTHFGRHGNVLATVENPFKKPILLMKNAAVLTLSEPRESDFLGVGIGGVSKLQPEAVHQGYAPVICLPQLNG